MKLTFEERLKIAEICCGSPMDINSAPIEEVKAAVDRMAKHLEKMDEENQRMTAFVNTEDFQALESRMLITTAAERAEFFKYGRSPVQTWLDDTGFPWPKQNVTQIDMDYAKHCANLDRTPTFLSWCINQFHPSIVINKTAALQVRDHSRFLMRRIFEDGHIPQGSYWVSTEIVGPRKCFMSLTSLYSEQ